MMKYLYTGLLFFSLSATAQDGLQAETENGKPFLVHNVSSGETLSSIGRNFKLSAGEIASFNKMNVDKALQKGQSIRIPLKSDNFSQTECSSCPKVYYKVMPKEGLYRIGLNFGNMKAETLKKLNNLPGDAVDIGQNLLVGYLSAPAGKMSGDIAQKATPSTENTTSTYKPNATPIVEKKPEAKPAEIVVKKDPVESKPKEQPKQAPPAETPKQQTAPPVQTSNSSTNNSNLQGSGAFTNEYEGKQNVSKNGTAAVFKSTSGWGDTKYYVLMNGVTPGTIIKVDNPSTSKSIYAKVLGELPQIKQNENVLLRISNAAAAALDGGEESLNVTINY